MADTEPDWCAANGSLDGDHLPWMGCALAVSLGVFVGWAAMWPATNRVGTGDSPEERSSGKSTRETTHRRSEAIFGAESPASSRAEQQRAWIDQLEAVRAPEARGLPSWSSVREALAAADGKSASELYSPIRIDVPEGGWSGLVPIGMNPNTRLWEFYDLRSAWDGTRDVGGLEIPRHRSDGSIDVQADTGIVFVLLPGGPATVGSQDVDDSAPFYDPERQPDETLRQAQLPPFLMARHELTRGQWRRLAGPWPSAWVDGTAYNGDPIPIGGSHPADSIDWHAAAASTAFHGLRLPTEVEWEYACRAGSDTVWWTGSTPRSLEGCANLHDRTSAAVTSDWGPAAPIDDGFASLAPVGRFRANGFGLHDMHGNVWEWCLGPYSPTRQDPSESNPRTCRGGSLGLGPWSARASHRVHCDPDLAHAYLGLRPVRDLRRPGIEPSAGQMSAGPQSDARSER